MSLYIKSKFFIVFCIALGCILFLFDSENNGKEIVYLCLSLVGGIVLFELDCLERDKRIKV